TLHWLVAIGIFALIWLGLEQSELPRGDEKTRIRMIHGSIALIVFALMTIRIIWRGMNETPTHPEGLPAWQALSATLVHWGLYIAIFVQLVSGAMTVATTGDGLPFFGLFQIPLPVAESRDAHEFWEDIHEPFWWVVAILVGVHILGALYNHFIAKNDVLRRMTSGAR
ncbi:MAG: cytochrome b, partial [Woeseiaceae bacterium]